MGFRWGNPRERNHLKDPDERIILRRTWDGGRGMD
jgi:hypothetical protein